LHINAGEIFVLQGGVAWEDVERYTTLTLAQDLLPKAHPENLHKRHVFEELGVSQSAHALSSMYHQFPSNASTILQPSMDEILVFGDSLQHSTCTDASILSLPASVPFSTYMDSFLLGGPGTEPKPLPALTYPINQREASIAHHSHVAVVSENTWATSQGSRMQIRGSEAVASVDTGGNKLQAVVHGAHGLHVVVEAVSTPSVASSSTSQTAPDPSDANHAIESQSLITTSEVVDPSQQTEQGHGTNGNTTWAAKLTSYTPAGCMMSVNQEGIFFFKHAGALLWRAVCPDGSVMTGSSDGNLEAWLSSGHKLELHKAANGGKAHRWVATAPDGARTQVGPCKSVASNGPDGSAEAAQPVEASNGGIEAEQAQEGSGASPDSKDAKQGGGLFDPTPSSLEASIRVDLDTGAEVCAREDLFTRVSYENGNVVMLYGDGGRSIRFADGSWIVEYPHMPAVQGTRDTVNCTLQHGVNVTWMRDNGALVLKQEMCVEVACLEARWACGASPCGIAFGSPPPTHTQKRTFCDPF
jgi:hypothetical protein